MDVKVFDLGLTDYGYSLEFQKKILADIKSGRLPSALIIAEHQPVITLGRMADKKNVLENEKALASKGICIFQVDRGGDVTYHGPGQLTLYPILDLKNLKKDLHLFLRFLEELAINCLKKLSIPAQRQQGKTGVWIRDKKIASIGISVKNWITFHGISLNVTNYGLENFKFIKPCGLDIEMTCVESVLNRTVSLDEVKNILLGQFEKQLENFYFSQVNNGEGT